LGCGSKDTEVRIAVPTTLLCFVLIGEPQIGAAQNQSVAKDGDYVGLEKMLNLTPEDRAARWFHENTLVIRNDEAILDKVPITIRHGKKAYSPADGGFLTYRTEFTRKDGQPVVSLRLFESDYLVFAKEKHDQYTKTETYPVTFVSDQVEFDGVRYKLSKVESWKLDRLLGLLNTEPLETSDNFVGVWKLNRDKSPHFDSLQYNPIPVYETVVIERQLDEFKIAYVSQTGRSSENDRQFITDMKGSDLAAPLSNATIMRLRQRPKFTRQDKDNFIEEGEVWAIEYKVSPDHQTMTVRQIPYMDNGFVRVLVYERVQ
jgi:hypothetical protein